MLGGLGVARDASEAKEVPRLKRTSCPSSRGNCLICHGENLQRNGLDLRTRDSVLKGGESGAAIVPGSAEESLVLKKVSSGAMPMGGEKLKDEEIEAIRRWINAGALKEGERPRGCRQATDRR